MRCWSQWGWKEKHRKHTRVLTYWEEEEEETHLVEERDTLPEPQTVKSQIGYIWWVAMPQQKAQILFMEMDSWSDQWVCELLKYTQPNPPSETSGWAQGLWGVSGFKESPAGPSLWSSRWFSPWTSSRALLTLFFLKQWEEKKAGFLTRLKF